MLEIKGNNKEIIESLMKHKDAKDVKISRKISKKMLYLILKFTKVQRIYITKGILKQLPEGSKEALEGVGVRVIIENRGKGRPSKYSEEIIRDIVKMKPREVAEKHQIPLRTVYYYKKKISLKESVQ